MQLTGGSILPLDISESFRGACSKTGQFTIEVVFQTTKSVQPMPGSEQRPARIISFSKDTGHRNFTLGQDASELVLRLTTSKYGSPNGLPHFVLGKIESGRPYHVVVTFDGTNDKSDSSTADKNLQAFVNGESVLNTRVEGNLSKWQKHHLVLGSEYDHSRNWDGIVERFSLHDHAVTPEVAEAMFQKVVFDASR